MTDAMDFERPVDPLFRNVPLPHEATIPVLGLPVRFRTNAAEVLAAVDEAFGRWRVLESRPDLVETRGATVRLVVQDGDEGVPSDQPGDGEGERHVEVRHRILGAHRVLFHTRGSVAFADPDRREGHAFVTPAFVRDRQHFRHAMVEAVTMATVTPLDRQPFHAAALARDGAAVLLAGPSGVGKSTLAWAAARRGEGVGVLSEDTVFLQSRPELRVWGLPGFLHLAPDAAARFPELGGVAPTLLASGKRKVVVDLGARDALPPLPVAERAAVCLVERGEAPPGLRRVEGSELLDRLTRVPEPGFDLFAETVVEPLGRLVQGGGWCLSLADDPDDVVPQVLEVLDALRDGTAGGATRG